MSKYSKLLTCIKILLCIALLPHDWCMSSMALWYFLHIVIFTFGILNPVISCHVEDNFCLRLIFQLWFFPLWDFSFTRCCHCCVAHIKFAFWQFTIYRAKNFTYNTKLNRTQSATVEIRLLGVCDSYKQIRSCLHICIWSHFYLIVVLLAPKASHSLAQRTIWFAGTERNEIIKQ